MANQTFDPFNNRKEKDKPVYTLWQWAGRTLLGTVGEILDELPPLVPTGAALKSIEVAKLKILLNVASNVFPAAPSPSQLEGFPREFGQFIDVTENLKTNKPQVSNPARLRILAKALESSRSAIGDDDGKKVMLLGLLLDGLTSGLFSFVTPIWLADPNTKRNG